MTVGAEGFLDLYDREAPVVLAYLRAAVGNVAEAEDLAAETFLRAWRAWPRFERTEAPPHHWLIRIARNLAIDGARRRARLSVVPLEAEAVDGAETPGVERLHLLAALGRVEEEERHLLALRAAGLRFSEIGRLVGKSEAAARMAWHRAARRLHEHLEG